jgi:outer membrane protein
MKMMWIGGFVLLTLFSGVSLSAQEVPKPLTLEESIRMALDRSLQLNSAVEGVVGSQFRQKGAFTNFLPAWTGQYSVAHFNEPSFVGSAGSVTGGTSKDVANFSTTLSQPLFTGGANLANYRLETLGVDISKTNVEVAKRDIILQVRENYFNILTAEKAVGVAQQTVKQFEAQLEVSKAFFEVGIVAKNDVLQAEVRLANARQGLVRAENALAVTRASFNTLLRRDINAPVRVVDILEQRAPILGFEESVDEALRYRHEIKAAQLSIQQAKEAVKIARADYFPTLSLLGNYNRTSEEPYLSGDMRADRWSVQGLATYTIFEWGRTAYRVGESKVKVNQAENSKTQLVEGIIFEVKQAYLNVLEAEKNIGVAQKAIEQGEENLRLNEERYKYQVATATEVLDAVTLLAQASINYYSALRDFNIAKARLDRAMGKMYP